jgi:hypothetical protein
MKKLFALQVCYIGTFCRFKLEGVDGEDIISGLNISTIIRYFRTNKLKI